MTGYRVVYCYLSCDGEGCEDETYCPHNERTLTEERRSAHRIGWRRKDGKDYCPECSKKMGLW